MNPFRLVFSILSKWYNGTNWQCMRSNKKDGARWYCSRYAGHFGRCKFYNHTDAENKAIARSRR